MEAVVRETDWTLVWDSMASSFTAGPECPCKGQKSGNLFLEGNTMVSEGHSALSHVHRIR
jgi:hypothetical protein